MPIEITMPRLSDTMEEGTLVSWHVKVGDSVKAGDVLADVETDKATMELPTYDEGTVAKLVADEGDEIGGMIAVLAEEGESVEDAAANAGGGSGGSSSSEDKAKAKAKAKSESGDDASQEKSKEEKQSEPAQKDTSSGDGERLRVSPVARNMAEDAGLDLTQLKGSGPKGRIIKRDVQKAIDAGGSESGSGSGAGGVKVEKAKADKPRTISPSSAPSSSPAPSVGAAGGGLEQKSIKLSQMRKTIAKRLIESKTTVPHFQVTVSVNVDPLMQLRKTLNTQLESQGVKLSVNDFVVRATALACLEHPVVNSSWNDSTIEQHGTVNVGVAVALPEENGGGLVVATLRGVENMGLRQVSADTKALAKKARDSGLSMEEMQGSTISISNLGGPQFGQVTSFTAIVNPPNAAILAIAAAVKQPVVRDGELTVGTQMNITLSGDHRVIDGAGAAEYLSTLQRLLENPAALLV